jgi:hypothetical protein
MICVLAFTNIGTPMIGIVGMYPYVENVGEAQLVSVSWETSIGETVIEDGNIHVKERNE